jgi:D-alanine-D-alanine ligase
MRSKKLRILLLTHEGHTPPEDIDALSDADRAHFVAEWDVIMTLRDLGHEVLPLEVADDLGPIRRAIEQFRPHVTFNMLLEFLGVGLYDAFVIAWLELQRVAYTGSNPRGLMLARDKALSKKVLAFHRIRVPQFQVFRKDRPVRRHKGLEFPLIVKSTVEEASMGISQASIVNDDERLRERAVFVHNRVGTDAIAEQYVEGREMNIGIIGNQRLTTLPVWEMDFGTLPDGNEPIATARIKWDLEYQRRINLRTGPATGLSPETLREIERTAKRAYRALDLSGFARMDLRLTPDGRVFVLEMNPNPDIKQDEDFAHAALHGGIDYHQLIARVVSLALRYQAPWKAS